MMIVITAFKMSKVAFRTGLSPGGDKQNKLIFNIT